MRELVLAAAFSLMLVSDAASQAMKCPVCMGANKALQYTGDNCICATITVPPAPPLPASTCPVEGYTERWDGTKWVCTPTKYLIGE